MYTHGEYDGGEVRVEKTTALTNLWLKYFAFTKLIKCMTVLKFMARTGDPEA